MIQLLTCLTSSGVSKNSFLKLATIDHINYGVFSYCLSGEDSRVACSSKRVGYDNQLYQDANLKTYVMHLYNDTEILMYQALVNDYAMGLINASSSEAGISALEYIEFLAVEGFPAVTKNAIFLESPANNPFSKMLIFHPLACGLAFLTLGINLQLILIFSGKLALKSIIPHKPAIILLDCLCVSRTLLAVCSLMTILVDIILFAPHVSSLVVLNIVFTCTFLLNAMFSSYYLPYINKELTAIYSE